MLMAKTVMKSQIVAIAVMLTVTFITAAARWPPRCYKPPTTGYCYGQYLSWFYDYNTTQCKMFTYSGCFGNLNRFPSEERCQQICLRNRPAHLVCSVSPEVGVCRASLPMWYFDPSLGVCRGFVYGGCGGNSNKFSSCEECMERCSGDYHVKGICKYLRRRFSKQFRKGAVIQSNPLPWRRQHPATSGNLLSGVKRMPSSEQDFSYMTE
ncbi:kunitz-type serine protease inhibitor A-like [Dermacentor silvarum]|uniref:kunitz-type serine protease inhibitor A-like n=1 Tax=Dermacentor silvarum TaxID=543639 RepID=UPI00189B90D9|nr:kunitz-type serine protease inhibitor A-like [Dermacentor silvarum]